MLGKNIFRGDLNMFLPKAVYYEKESENYELGKEGITFIYNADEIAAYEVGAIRLTLPYSRLETHTK